MNITREQIKKAKEAAYNRYMELQRQYNEVLSHSYNGEKYIESAYDDVSVFAKIINIDDTSVDTVMVDTDDVRVSNEMLTYTALEEDYVASTKEKFEEAFNWTINKLKENINE